jgi:hypothetical protein
LNRMKIKFELFGQQERKESTKMLKARIWIIIIN